MFGQIVSKLLLYCEFQFSMLSSSKVSFGSFLGKSSSRSTPKFGQIIFFQTELQLYVYVLMLSRLKFHFVRPFWRCAPPRGPPSLVRLFSHK